MVRTLGGTVTIIVALLTGLSADDGAKLPNKPAHLQVAFASAEPEGEDGVRLRLLAPAFRTVAHETEIDKEGRREKVRATAVVQEGWREVVLPVGEEGATILDARGKEVDPKSLLARLKKRAAVALCVGERPEPFDLQTLKDDAFVVVVGTQRLLEASLSSHERAEVTTFPPGSGLHSTSFLKVGQTYRFVYGDGSGTAEVLEPACDGWVKVRYREKFGEIGAGTSSWINLSQVRQVVAADQSSKKTTSGSLESGREGSRKKISSGSTEVIREKSSP